MAEPVPAWLAKALPDAGAGHGRLAIVQFGSEDLLGKSGFQLRSAAFSDGDELDPCFTAEEEDAVAPPLEWTDPPAGAHELALVVEDANAPADKPSCHWLVWGLPAQKGKLLEGEVPPRVGKNSFGNSEWLLPNPPEEGEPHEYVFQLFALDLPLTLMPGATRDELIAAMNGHVIGAALLTAKFAPSGDDFEDWEDEDEG
ncbi:hypothetical protein FHS61_001380 [Altererythrobacter atlanticus]|uniref:Kinase inhibitor protein n=1 Tax=Croceibacterium atlanticum TaxID=1267766 RepID=A0A0F7KXW7_9SPHN|nr:YbhB/YbcL family Raf kinase inhibitor-like protein [Croceibacterium atlanticum]AKH44062.1 putative kinase inhibitor protein [Croceibacterium atlanticum]MBB5732371.1 hypothetical protein [Croceibacterium atlanticum]